MSQQKSRLLRWKDGEKQLWPFRISSGSGSLAGQWWGFFLGGWGGEVNPMPLATCPSILHTEFLHSVPTREGRELGTP